MSVSIFLQQATPTVTYHPIVLDALEEDQSSPPVLPELPQYTEVKHILATSGDIGVSLATAFANTLRSDPSSINIYQQTIKYNNQPAISLYHFPDYSLLICSTLLKEASELDWYLANYLLNYKTQIYSISQLLFSDLLPALSSLSSSTTNLPMLPQRFSLHALPAAIMIKSTLYGSLAHCLVVRDAHSVLDVYGEVKDSLKRAMGMLLKEFEVEIEALDVVEKALGFLVSSRKPKASYFV
ncbi:hypothetical protein P9112_004269 [Eukaryota sp. TZLM1-RC]